MSDHDGEPSPHTRLPRDDDQEQQYFDPASAAPPGISAAVPTEPITASATGTPPVFEPLFTLVTNTTNNTSFHPRVHYLFADDDPTILPAGSGPPDLSHRALVLDLVPAADSPGGWSVAWASSLSPSFAITDSSISSVQQGHRDVMLRIEGIEREPVQLPRNTGGSRSGSPSNATGSSAAASSSKDEVDALVDDFRRRMGLIKKIVDQGHKRREALDQQQQQQLDDEDYNYDGEDPAEEQQHSPTDTAGKRLDDMTGSPRGQA